MQKPAITVIDDDESTRSLLTSILRVEGYTEVRAVSDDHEGLENVEKLRAGVIFLDIEMPRQDGFEVLSRIKAVRPDCFVVMVSAHTSVDNVNRAVDLGASAFMAKPYTIGKIRDVLSRYWQRASSHDGRDQEMLSG